MTNSPITETPSGARREATLPDQTPTPAGRPLPLIVRLGLLLSYPALALVWLWPGLFHRDDTFRLLVSYVVFMMRTFSWHIGLGLALIAAWAVWRRDRACLAATLVPMLVFLGPGLADFLPRTAPPINGEPVCVMHFNLLHSNDRSAVVADQIDRADPDVLLLHEYDRQWDRALGPKLAAAYPFAVRHPAKGSFGWAVFSRLPIVEPARNLVPPEVDNRTIVRTVLLLDGQQVACYAVHLNPPKNLRRLLQQRQALDQLTALLAEETLPLLLCGDFNFTCRHRMHRLLADQGLAEAHQLAGWGRGSTWPASGLVGYVPGVRIDHIYLRGGLTCGSITTGSPCGSDHRPIIAEVGFAAPQPARVD